MGQPISVVEKQTTRRDVRRFEINRSLTGMGHERYRQGDEIPGARPPDELARRLLANGGVEAVHIFSNQITVDLLTEAAGEGLLEVIQQLFIHYREGVSPSLP